MKPVLAEQGVEPHDEEAVEGGQSVQVPAVPPEALCNVDPYRLPKPVPAGDGYVTCALPDDVALRSIFRRGVWDLSKGAKAPPSPSRRVRDERCARRWGSTGSPCTEPLGPRGTAMQTKTTTPSKPRTGT